MDGIDPDYLAALPPELQAEVLEQQRAQRRQARAVRAQLQQAPCIPSCPGRRFTLAL